MRKITLLIAVELCYPVPSEGRYYYYWKAQKGFSR